MCLASLNGLFFLFTISAFFSLTGIYTLNLDGSGLTPLAQDPQHNNALPAWSPDGLYVAFVSDRDGNFEVYAMKADGSGQGNLTRNSATDRDPAWFVAP